MLKKPLMYSTLHIVIIIKLHIELKGICMNQTLQLSVQSADSTDEEIAELTRELNKWISDNVSECEISQPEGTPGEGQKGFSEIFNSLNIFFDKLDFLNLFAQCLTTYITQRRRTLVIDVTNQAGDKVSLSAENLGRGEISDLVGQLKELANKAPA